MQGEDDDTQVVDTWRAPASYKYAWDQYDIHLSTSPPLQHFRTTTQRQHSCRILDLRDDLLTENY